MGLPGAAGLFSRACRLRNHLNRCDSVAGPRGGNESEMKAIAMIHKLETYAGLVQQIRNDLRLQHPDWVQPNGQCPMCDSYEARLLELLDVSITGEANEHPLPPIFS